MNKSKQTKTTFSQKWGHFPSLIIKQTLDPRSDIHNWILNRNGFKNVAQSRKKLSQFKSVLDAGCGNGRVSLLLAEMMPQAQITGIDIIDTVIARRNCSTLSDRIAIKKADLMKDLSRLGMFDFIYCQEVLHHTRNPEKAFANLVKVLSPKGKMTLYVYKKKAPVREFVDDFIRDKMADLSHEEVMDISRSITDLGRLLAKDKTTFTTKDIPVLGIKSGSYTIQRFLYHFFLKCFWSDELSYNENVMINYDWYRPSLCARYTLDEVMQLFKKNKLDVVYSHEDFYGITVHGVKSQARKS